MTETQTTINHRAPLARGEIRKHTVGRTIFQVMHASGGMFTQASMRHAEVGPTTVLKTSMHEHEAIAAYADAIEQVERDVEILTFNLPMGADMTLVTGEPRPAPLAELLDAYGEAMAKAAMYVTRSNGMPAATLWAGNADRLKTEILARFGGDR